MRCALVLIGLLLLVAPSLACANDSGVYTKIIEEIERNSLPEFLLKENWKDEAMQEIAGITSHTRRDWQALEKNFASYAYQGMADGPSLDDAHSVALMHLGRADEAVSLLLKSEKSYPGRYATAANLGTAYELSGNLDKALFWIEEGIHRNPEAHEGTEWLHVRILKARIGLRDDPKSRIPINELKNLRKPPLDAAAPQAE